MRPPERGRSSFQALVAGAAAVAVLVLTIAGARSYHDLVAVKTREAEIERRIEEANRRIESLEREIDLLRDDPATLERHAREDLGLVKPGDLVILLPPEEPERPEEKPQTLP